LPTRGFAPLRFGRADSGAIDGAAGRGGARVAGGYHRLALRAARAGLYHNTAVTLNADGAIAGVYRKMHIPDDPLYHEKYYFAPGIWVFER